MKKKFYIKPKIEKIILDNTISLQMATFDPPAMPDKRGDGAKSPAPDPFASPFGNKPFN